MGGSRQESRRAVSAAAGRKVHDSPDTRDHLVELDSLRGIAILGVFLTHITAHWQTQVGPLIVPYLNFDALEAIEIRGVPLFFLLSGYLLTWTEGKRARRGDYSLRSYALRRILRLVPAYYVSIAVVVLLWPRPPSLWDIVSHALFIHGFFPETARTLSPAMWSLTPEVAFYFLLPFVILFLPKLWHRLVLFVALFVVSLPTQFYILENFTARAEGQIGDVYLYQYYSSLPSTYLYLFIGGMLLRMLVERLNRRPAVPPWQPRVALGLLVVSVSYMEIAPHLDVLRPENPVLQTLVIGLQDLMLLSFFAAAVLGAPILRRLLNWGPLQFIGMTSYSMFLLHQTVIMMFYVYVLRDAPGWLQANDGPTVWLAYAVYFVVVFGLSSLVAYLSYRFIESLFLKIKPK